MFVVVLESLTQLDKKIRETFAERDNQISDLIGMVDGIADSIDDMKSSIY